MIESPSKSQTNSMVKKKKIELKITSLVKSSHHDIYLGTFETFAISNGVQLTSLNGRLLPKLRNFQIWLQQDEDYVKRGGIAIKRNSKEQVKNGFQTKQWIKQNSFLPLKCKQECIKFQPFYLKFWCRALRSKELRIQFYLNLPEDYQNRTLFVPIRIDIFISKLIFNQNSEKVIGKPYNQFVSALQQSNKRLKNFQDIYKKLQKSVLKKQISFVYYKGIKYCSDLYEYKRQNNQKIDNRIKSLYELQQQGQQLTKQNNYLKSLIEQEKIIRLFVLYLIQKMHVKVLNKGFIKPKPRTNYLIGEFIQSSFGRFMLKYWKYRDAMNMLIRAPKLNILIMPDQGLQDYYKNIIGESFIRKYKLGSNNGYQKGYVYKPPQDWKQLVQEQQKYPLIWTEDKQITKKLHIQQQRVKQQLGLSKNTNSIENKQVKQENQKLLKQFEEENKYFIKHPTPEQMQSQLKPYQAQALQWMKYRQGKLSVEQLFEKQYIDSKDDFEFQRKLSPFWQEIQFLNGKTAFINHLTGQLTFKFHQWKAIRGGILADQMGLGKTVMAISLMVDQNFQGTNLIVVPVNVLKQWMNQFKIHCKKEIKIYQYHSNNNKRNIDLSKYDVVMTTYGTLGNQYKAYVNAMDQQNKQKKFLFDYNFKRIILDQAQNIKSPVTLQFAGAYNIKAQFKWCLTGTLVQNSQQDLFSIFKFLNVEVFEEQYWWNAYIKRCPSQDDKFNILHTVLRPIALRRTKESTTINGQAIITLPEKQLIVRRPSFSQEEIRIYKQLEKGIKSYLIHLTQKQKNSFTHIFQIIARLRQFCCHPSLVFKKKLEQINEKDIQLLIGNFLNEGSNTYKKSKANQLLNTENNGCPICLQQTNEDAVITKCGHIYCEACLVKLLNQMSPKCSICRKNLDRQFLKKCQLDKNKISNDKIDSMIALDSSKIKAIVADLQAIKNRKQKCVIFSQFLMVIQILKEKIDNMKVKWTSITGNMNKNQRSRSDLPFIIVSLRAGGTGLNLTMANNVMICDPWWNPAFQDQATHRVHRIGQKHKVNVYRYLMKNSIEQKIQKMHQKKRALAEKVMMKMNKNEQKQQKVTQQMIRMIIE